VLEDAVVAAIRERTRRGWSIRAIAKEFGVHRETVRRYLRQGPTRVVQTRPRARCLNIALREHGREFFVASAHHNAVRVLEELKKLGAAASIATVRRAVRDLRRARVRLETAPPESLQASSSPSAPTAEEIERDLGLARRFARAYERDDPDELESELMAVLAKLEVHRHDSRTWEARVVKAFKNRCLNWRRDRSRHNQILERLDQTSGTDDDAPPLADLLPGAGDDVASRLAERLARQELDSWHRKVLDALILTHGVRAEAARLLGVSRGTIQNALPRINAVLAKHGFRFKC
jgi:DNA-directed RNA polymerase specialized sigma24 family protein